MFILGGILNKLSACARTECGVDCVDFSLSLQQEGGGGKTHSTSKRDFKATTPIYHLFRNLMCFVSIKEA